MADFKRIVRTCKLKLGLSGEHKILVEYASKLSERGRYAEWLCWHLRNLVVILMKRQWKFLKIDQKFLGVSCSELGLSTQVQDTLGVGFMIQDLWFHLFSLLCSCPFSCVAFIYGYLLKQMDNCFRSQILFQQIVWPRWISFWRNRELEMVGLWVLFESFRSKEVGLPPRIRQAYLVWHCFYCFWVCEKWRRF